MSNHQKTSSEASFQERFVKELRKYKWEAPDSLNGNKQKVTVNDLVNHWRGELNRINADQLEGLALTDSEFAQVLVNVSQIDNSFEAAKILAMEGTKPWKKHDQIRLARHLVAAGVAVPCAGRSRARRFRIVADRHRPAVALFVVPCLYAFRFRQEPAFSRGCLEQQRGLRQKPCSSELVLYRPDVYRAQFIDGSRLHS